MITAVEKIQHMCYLNTILIYFFIMQEKFANLQKDNEKLKMQMEKLNREHKTEIDTMKQYFTECKLPESALQPLYRQDRGVLHNNVTSSRTYDDQAWRAEFGAIYQDYY